jgi:hypothetical protein
LIVKNTTKFASRYPGVTPNATFTLSLDNAGEELTLATATGGAVLTVDYDDDPPWPGHRLMVRDSRLFPSGTNYNSDTGTNWRASANVHGSPKADDPSVNIPPIVINEALTSSVPPQKDSIELFNPTGSPVNIGDWWLSDERDTPKKYRIPAGTIIPANGYVVFDESQFNPTPGVGLSFGLSGTGENIYVFSGNASGNLTVTATDGVSLPPSRISRLVATQIASARFTSHARLAAHSRLRSRIADRWSDH